VPAVAGRPDRYRVYDDLAPWWPLISPVTEYAADAAVLRSALGLADGQVRTALDLGCGGGHVAAHLKDALSMTLVDLSAQMLAMSRQLNPECEHELGDMRTLRLGRRFDAVLVHDAVDYITTAADLDAVLGTAFAHCRPGGVAVFMPDHTAETFRPGSGGGGSTDSAGRQASFREWTSDPDPADDWIESEYEFVLRDADGAAQVVRETHQLGAFSRGTWLSSLARAGFTPQARALAELAPGGSADARRPAGRGQRGGACCDGAEGTDARGDGAGRDSAGQAFEPDRVVFLGLAPADPSYAPGPLTGR
jgi:SAM-dependent methyltransferase